VRTDLQINHTVMNKQVCTHFAWHNFGWHKSASSLQSLN